MERVQGGSGEDRVPGRNGGRQTQGFGSKLNIKSAHKHGGQKKSMSAESGLGKFFL